MQPKASRLPKTIRELALAQFNMLSGFKQRRFDRCPQLLTMPSGRRIKWTEAGESSKYDFPWWIPYWHNDEKLVKDAVWRIRYVMVEIEYERRRSWLIKSVTI